MLREADVWLETGEKMGLSAAGWLSEQSYYRWRREYGGLKVTQAAQLKSLEKANARRGTVTVPSGRSQCLSIVISAHERLPIG